MPILVNMDVLAKIQHHLSSLTPVSWLLRLILCHEVGIGIEGLMGQYQYQYQYLEAVKFQYQYQYQYLKGADGQYQYQYQYLENRDFQYQYQYRPKHQYLNTNTRY